MTGRRILAGHKGPGDTTIIARAADDAAPVHLTTPRTQREHSGMTRPISNATNARQYVFRGFYLDDDGKEKTLATAQGPATVVASAAREYGSLIDPLDQPAGRVDVTSLSWLDWLSKLLPFLRRR